MHSSKLRYICFSGYLTIYKNACGSVYFLFLSKISSSNPVYYSYLFLKSS